MNLLKKLLFFFFRPYGCVARDVFFLPREIVVGTQIIMDISKFSDSSSKKRDFSNQSCNGEEPKNVREGRLNDSSVALDYVFTEGMKSPECLHILVNCMKNIEVKIKETCEMNQVTQDNQIKGEYQLRDLFKSIELYKEKFNELEMKKGRRRKSMNW